MRSKAPVRELVSAGGLVCRVDDGRTRVVVCDRNSPPVTALPKGTPEPGETFEEAAVREVGEETGLEVEIQAFIGTIDYWFALPDEGVRCYKTVYYYLMSATGGDVSRHDREFDGVRWVLAEEALDMLTYDNEVGVVQKGVSIASQRPEAE